MMEELEITDRKIVRKLSEAVKDAEQYRKRHDNKLCSHSKTFRTQSERQLLAFL